MQNINYKKTHLQFFSFSTSFIYRLKSELLITANVVSNDNANCNSHHFFEHETYQPEPDETQLQLEIV